MLKIRTIKISDNGQKEVPQFQHMLYKNYDDYIYDNHRETV